MWLSLAGAGALLMAAHALSRVGGPFKPILNEVEEIGRQTLLAAAALLVVVAAVVG